MRVLALMLTALAMAQASAADLPKMSFINENSLLDSFPLGTATKEQIYETYGPPQSTVTGLPFDGESWTYSKGTDSKQFVFVFRKNIVHDVIVRYPAGGFLAGDRSARKIQGGK